MNLFVLYKIVDSDTVRDLLLDGNIRFRPLKYFAKYENSEGEKRGDKEEGASAVFSKNSIPKTAVIKFGDHVVNNDAIISAVFHNKYDLVNRYVYCFGAIYAENSIEVDKNGNPTANTMKFYKDEFPSGKHVIAFLGNNIKHFFERIDKKIVKYDDACRRFVLYTDTSTRAPGFEKSKDFINQNEYRVMFSHDEAEYVDIHIGSLIDIAHVYTLDEFDQLLNDIQITPIL